VLGLQSLHLVPHNSEKSKGYHYLSRTLNRELIHGLCSEEDNIIASWNRAKLECEKKLSTYDYEKLKAFPTPDKLAEDLRTQEQQRPNLWKVRRPIKTIRSFFEFFLVTMAPRNIESSIFWGVLYLLVEVGSE
jgi:hypothetical protein